MSDHTEREREARGVYRAAAWLHQECGDEESEVKEQMAFDALMAVRTAAVLAEVRAKVEACPRVRYTDPLGFYLRTVLDVADIRAALTALEATDGR